MQRGWFYNRMIEKCLTLFKFVSMLDSRIQIVVHISNYPYGRLEYSGNAAGFHKWNLYSSFWDSLVTKIGLNHQGNLHIVAMSKDY